MGRKKNVEERNKIIRISYRLFRGIGYNSVTTRQIADQCGISRSLLHHYFNHKEEIAAAIVKPVQITLMKFVEEKFSIPADDQGALIFSGLIFFKAMLQLNLLNMFQAVCENPRLMNDITIDFYSSEFKRDKNSSLDDFGKGLFLFTGIYMQFVRCKQSGLVNETYDEILYFAQKLRYEYLGWEINSFDKIYKKAANLITQNVIDDFIRYFEKIEDWS